MNGVSVSPGQILQNAPTWQVEKQAGRGVFFSYFLSFYSPHTTYLPQLLIPVCYFCLLVVHSATMQQMQHATAQPTFSVRATRHIHYHHYPPTTQ